MNMVQPIRDVKNIERMKAQLSKGGTRDKLLFILGINTGLRISDILKLKVEDVRDRSHIVLIEQKTGKSKRFLLNDQLAEELRGYTEGMEPGAYLFQSRRGDNMPISRVQAYRILNEAAAIVGLEAIGTHSLRKTFGYHHYKRHKDVAILQDILNHSAPSVTLRYIGISQDNKDETIKGFYL
ncbi:site-specific integrase [Desulfosporosinus fructosivorans]